MPPPSAGRIDDSSCDLDVPHCLDATRGVGAEHSNLGGHDGRVGE